MDRSPEPRIYFPKGGMCTSCAHRLGDCSTLEFKDMPPLKTYRHAGKTFHVVKCSKWERRPDAEKPHHA